MAIACSRCGTQNPDGNQFCQACGASLAAVAAFPGGSAPLPGPQPGPPAPPPMSGGMTPAQAPPAPPGPYGAPGYSPYYPPSAGGPQQPVHRTPWVLIVGVIIGLIVILSGCGIVIAVVGVNRTSTPTKTSGILPKPTPATSPSPAATPTGSPTATPRPSPKATPSSGGGKTVSNAGETITLPTGWSVASKDDQTISLIPPSNDGSVTIASGPSNPAQTAQQNKATLDKFFQNSYPDTKDCPSSHTNTSDLMGANGIFWELCFTFTSSGSSFPAGAPLFAGANKDGSNYFVVILITKVENMDNFITAATPVLQSIQWKLST